VTHERERAETMERGGRIQIVGEIANVDVGEATLRQERLVLSGIPDRNMAFDLAEDPACTQPFHEVGRIRRVQVQRRVRLQRAVDGPEDPNELVIVDVLGEVQRKRRVETVGMLGTEGHDVGAVKRADLDPPCVPPPLRRAHERVGEIDADIFVDVRGDELEQDTIAASEVGDDFMARQLEKRKHAPDPSDRMRVVLVDVALPVNCMQLVLGEAAHGTGVAMSYIAAILAHNPAGMYRSPS